jgi:hypothetical protein
MAVLAVLVALKASLAMLLVVAGLSKAADLPAFRDSVAVLVPRLAGGALALALAVGAAGTEVVVGVLSLALPGLAPADAAVLALCAGFLVVSMVGAWSHRGVHCRCFGALSDQRFGVVAAARSAVLVVAAAVVVAGHGAFAAMPLPRFGEWSLVVLAMVPTGAAFVLAGRVLRAARGRQVSAR